MPIRYSDIDGKKNPEESAGDDLDGAARQISQADLTEFFAKKEEHHQIDKTLLIPGSTIHFPLLLQKDCKLRTVYEASAESPARIEEWIPLQEGDFMIRRSDISVYSSYLTKVLKEDLAGKADTGKIKVRAMRENSKIVVRELFDNPRSGERLRASTEMVHGLIDGIMKDRNVVTDMLSLRDYDYYTYTHSVNVAVLSIGLAAAVGLEPRLVEILGIGAILHDIGKSALPAEIVNKQGNLDAGEYEVMKTHVLEGEKILRGNQQIPDESLYAVLHHHEKLSGNGYPGGLTAGQIHLYGKICAIADCYDAMTTDRPYRRALAPFGALSIIVRETDNYDNDLLTVFIRMLGGLR